MFQDDAGLRDVRWEYVRCGAPPRYVEISRSCWLRWIPFDPQTKQQFYEYSSTHSLSQKLIITNIVRCPRAAQSHQSVVCAFALMASTPSAHGADEIALGVTDAVTLQSERTP